MPEDVPHPVAETVPEVGDDVVGGMTVGAGVAAVFDQGHFRPGVSEDMIAFEIDGAVQSSRSHAGHDRASTPDRYEGSVRLARAPRRGPFRTDHLTRSLQASSQRETPAAGSLRRCPEAFECSTERNTILAKQIPNEAVRS